MQTAWHRQARDTLDDVLAAPDRDVLMTWLAHRPLAWHEGGHLLVHAGLPPMWTIDDALARAAEVQTALQGPGRKDFLARLHQPPPERWSNELRGVERLQCIAATLTRLRACAGNGRAALRYTGPPDRCPDGTAPWFACANRAWRGTTIVFGHWAALGARRGEGWIALDSGCVWGGALTALRLEDGASGSVPAQGPQNQSRRAHLPLPPHAS